MTPNGPLVSTAWLHEHLATQTSSSSRSTSNPDVAHHPRRDALQDLYTRHGVGPGRPIVTYCRIGEPSAHTWFALHEHPRLDAVRNYDGSWTEWGSMIAMPVESGA